MSHPVTITFNIPELKTLEEYKQKGRYIRETYCVNKDNLPLMLPPAPNQKYIDDYREEEEGSICRVGEKRRQANYEAEVKVYRSLERL